MCGITGFFSYKNKINTKKYYDAHKKIAHRGPDDEGFLYKNNNTLDYLKGDDTIPELQNREHVIHKQASSLILGHRRLSIIDLTKAGHQPLVHENLSLVYNGEIYNYIELRDELIHLGYSFQTNTDTEVFLKAYHYWGIDAFHRFNGMWAAAIYDENLDNMVLTRDRFGIKPLYYSLVSNNLIFGSEIKFVASFMEKLYPNEQMVYDYIEYNYIDHTHQTFFNDIKKISAGCYYIFNQSSFTQFNYYKDDSVKHHSLLYSIKELLIDSIKIRMRADVETGSLLSGGIDSSSIVNIIKDKNLSSEFQTFTMSYKGKEEDYEEKYVKDTIQKTKYDNTTIYLQPEIKIVDELVSIIESPYKAFSENAAYNIYKYVKTNTNIKVLLNGEGADEIFCGYTSHLYHYLYQLICELKFILFVKEFLYIKKNLSIGIFDLVSEITKVFIIDKNLRKYFKSNIFFKNKHFINRIMMHKKSLRNKMLVNRKYSSLPEYLNYADKISMNFSLEVRMPFLDFRLVEQSLQLKDAQLIKNGVTKYTLREAMRGIIPESIYSRKDKKGFFTPQDKWFKDELQPCIEDEIKYIKDKGLFSFMNHNEIYKYYLKNGIDYKLWNIYCLSRWKKIWKVEC